MHLIRLELRNLRNLVDVVLEPGAGLNLLVGRNGAGKMQVRRGHKHHLPVVAKSQFPVVFIHKIERRGDAIILDKMGCPPMGSNLSDEPGLLKQRGCGAKVRILVLQDDIFDLRNGYQVLNIFQNFRKIQW